MIWVTLIMGHSQISNTYKDSDIDCDCGINNCFVFENDVCYKKPHVTCDHYLIPTDRSYGYS